MFHKYFPCLEYRESEQEMLEETFKDGASVYVLRC